MSFSGKSALVPMSSGVADPAGGTTIDTQARATLANLLANLRAHGLIDG